MFFCHVKTLLFREKYFIWIVFFSKMFLKQWQMLKTHSLYIIRFATCWACKLLMPLGNQGENFMVYREGHVYRRPVFQDSGTYQVLDGFSQSNIFAKFVTVCPQRLRSVPWPCLISLLGNRGHVSAHIN